jgi:succinoglycan biosynthesis transport protein ExoP
MKPFYPDIEQQGDNAVPELTLPHIWAIVKRRNRIFFLTIAAVTVFVILLGLFSTRRYESKGEIQIQKDSTDALGLDSMMVGTIAAESDALNANITLQTEAKIMESQTLALTVIDRLQIADDPDFKARFNPIIWAIGLISPSGPPDHTGKPLGDSPKNRERLFGAFKKNIKVVPVSGTRLIDITYTSSNPTLSAAIVNQVIDGLVDYNFQTRYTATSQTSDWLAKQLSELRSNSDDLQRQVADLQRSSGVFTFGGQDMAGKGLVYSTVLDQLQQSTVNLTQAESNRIMRGAIYEASKSGNPESVASLVTSGTSGSGSAAVGQSLALLQSFRSQEASQRAQISEFSAKYGPAYTRLDEMKASLTSIQRSIFQEQERLKAQAKSDFEIAEQFEDRTRAAFEEQKKSAVSLNGKAIQYQLLRQEADQSRDLYTRLQSRLKEAGVLEGLRSSNITVVEPGRVSARPSSPNVVLLLLTVLVGGPIAGLAFIFCIEIMDGKINDPRTIADRFGADYFGRLPLDVFKSSKRISPTTLLSVSSIFTIARPQSPYSEALRSVRTALLSASEENTSCQVVLITSCTQQEGKSTTAANLAVQLAECGKRVLLMDADLRSKTIRLLSDQSHIDGLSTILARDRGSASVVTHAIPEIIGLSYISSGPLPSHPSEMLGSIRMRHLVDQFRKQFDFIVLDTPPVLCVTDSVLLASLADQVLLIARYASTDATDLERSHRLLKLRAPRATIGVVINGV